MNDASGEPTFEPDEPPSAPTSSIAAAEQKAFGAGPTPPNSLSLFFGRFGQLSWHSDSSTAVLALIVLVILCFLVLSTIMVSTVVTDKSWLGGLLQALGNAISGVAGAIVGASAAGNKKKR
ncbi:hypothetical protein [Bradyrhizobium sp. ORS 86]|uniref:hypothetical protein n=1 Tax=Bradyrhizobium sp. ORS 86 TaxID=1685970 RepID=UPI00388CF5F2